jgi:PKD domain
MRGRRRGFVHRLSGAIGVLILAATGSAVLVLGPAEAGAVITEPIPADVGPTPPPIPALPPAGDTAPPPEAIGDPIEPAATCGSWYQQSAYGGTWPTPSTWWEYRCRYEYPQCTGACNANWVPSTYDDYFYWDGSRPIFYGEFYGDYYAASLGYGDGCEYWWDAPAGRWYRFESPVLYPDGGWWNYCGAPANAAPTASFTSSCSGLTCNFDADGSTDSDGWISNYSWVFGDGTSGSGKTTTHTYAQTGTYTVALTVTDDAGATATEATSITLIWLTATYKVKGFPRVELSWSGPSGASFTVYRDGVVIATISATAYTDNFAKGASGSHTYQVCEAGTLTSCSNKVTVTF